MSYTKYLVLGLLALTCVGCATAKKPDTTTNQTQPQAAVTKPADLPPQTATVVTPDSQPTTPSAVSTTTATTQPATPSMKFEVDETWQTYTNKALSFEFQWPTKGRYAPEWSVEFRKSDDSTIAHGCVYDSKTYGSDSMYKDFCHTTSVIETDAIERTDYFATKKGNQYIVVTFFKKLYPDEKYKANSHDDYEAMLETIMSTFKYTE